MTSESGHSEFCSSNVGPAKDCHICSYLPSQASEMLEAVAEAIRSANPVACTPESYSWAHSLRQARAVLQALNALSPPPSQASEGDRELLASEFVRDGLALRASAVRAGRFPQAERAIARARQDEREALLPALQAAAERFREYERSHEAKANPQLIVHGEPDRRDEYRDKAQRNREMAEMCEAAIRARSSEQGA